jgi:peptidoglycan/LPS O-acetylase OafA/YrhL
VFFVLSGYLITGLLVKEMDTKGRINFLQFYARRARRLLPAAATMLLVVLAAARLLLPPLEQHLLVTPALSTALYSSNIFFAHRSTDYLAFDALNNPLLHTWSLAVEEQFYLFWPLLVMLGIRHRPADQNRRRLWMVLGTVTVISFAGCVWLSRTAQPWAFFGSPARAWEFAVGGLPGGATETFGRTCRRPHDGHQLRVHSALPRRNPLRTGARSSPFRPGAGGFA